MKHNEFACLTVKLLWDFLIIGQKCYLYKVIRREGQHSDKQFFRMRHILKTHCNSIILLKGTNINFG